MTRTPDSPPADPCTMVVFGASGDLTKRLLVPSLYNLAHDGLLPERFEVLGFALSEMTSEQFGERLTEGLRDFGTQGEVDEALWASLLPRLHYMQGGFEEEEAFARLGARLDELAEGTDGNVLFYLATPPAFFGVIAERLVAAGLNRVERGWRRLVVEKPFGDSLASARELNASLRRHWQEEQIFRIDHYLGKETVQNLLAFRFANGMFEPLWNKHHVCHVQFTVAESVGVGERGAYYEKSGVLRDMIQNHMFQMLAYLCMEPPSSFDPDAIRNEKAKVLEAVRIMAPEDVARETVRGQYGPGTRPDGSPIPGYREEARVAADSVTPTFAAMRLHVDNWRWEGVPIYLRSGKSLWKRGTEILVQFKKAPEVLFRRTPIGRLENNQLIFHVQPDQGIELRLQAKRPGPLLSLQVVDMRFDYQDSFEAARATGYEVLLYQCMRGDATLFTRDDLVEAAWRIAQPILDAWDADPPDDFPNYPAGTWGPKEAFELIEEDGREWLSVINRESLEQVPIFANTSPVFLHALALVLRPSVHEAGEVLFRQGDPGEEMYLIARGRVEVIDSDGRVLDRLGVGGHFGELSLLRSAPRAATARTVSPCDLYALEKSDLQRVLRDHPHFARTILESCRRRYGVDIGAEAAFGSLLAGYVEGAGDDEDERS